MCKQIVWLLRVAKKCKKCVAKTKECIYANIQGRSQHLTYRQDPMNLHSVKQLPETSFSAPAVCFKSPSLHSHSPSHTAVHMQPLLAVGIAMRIIVSIVSSSIKQGALLNNCTIEPWYFRAQNVLIFFSIHQGSLLTRGLSFLLSMLEYAAVHVDLSKQTKCTQVQTGSCTTWAISYCIQRFNTTTNYTNN